MIEKPYIKIVGAGTTGPAGPPGPAGADGADGVDAEAIIGIFTASENITPPEYLVNIFDSGGEKIRRAIANDVNKLAHGFIKQAVLSGNTITVYKKGSLIGLSGKTIGKRQFLSNSSEGQMTESTILVNDEGRQIVGEAVRATEVYMNIQDHQEVILV